MPFFSIITATYNRSATLARAIESVLRQEDNDWELIIVDDGSTDNTQLVLENYNDLRIKIFKHECNKGACAAKNTGFNNISGDWFTTLDSDDEMMPGALSVFKQIINNNPQIDAITCNCIDSATGSYSGIGIEMDGLLDFEDMIEKCRGEHWGITKTSLLGDMRFNEKSRGGEDILWFKLSFSANRYYTHQALRIYHTEGTDRICSANKRVDINQWISSNLAYAEELDYLKLLLKYRPNVYSDLNSNIALALALNGEKSKAIKILISKFTKINAKYYLTWFVVIFGRFLGKKIMSKRII